MLFIASKEYFKVHKMTPYMIYGVIQQLKYEVLKTGLFVPTQLISISIDDT